MSLHDHYSGALSSLREAAFDDALWPAASGRIDEACGMRGNTLVMATGHSREDADILFARTCRRGERHEAWERSYFEDYFPLDEPVPRVTRLRDSRLVPTTHLYTAQERKISATYNEALRVGRYQNGLNVRLDGPDGASIYWALADSTRRGGWGSGQIAMIESLLPHLRHFLRTRHTLVGAQALSAALAGLIDNSRLGVIQLDRTGRIIEANDRARALLKAASGLSELDGHLYAPVPAEDTPLRELLVEALPRFRLAAIGGSMTVSRRPSRMRQVIHVLPLGDRQRDFGTGCVAALVVMVEPGGPARLDAELVASALGLTQTDIAKDRGLQLNTARFHNKQIHARLGLSRQTDLVRLVLSLADGPVPRREQSE